MGLPRCAFFYLFAGFLALVVTASGQAVAEENVLPPEEVDFFERRIRPVLVARCYECHSAQADAVEGELRLDSRAGWQQGGVSGAAIVPGDPDASPLMEAIRHEGLEMPPEERLPDEVVADFQKWIARGAVDPREEDATAATDAPAGIDWEEARQFWSFQPPRKQALPTVEHGDWPRQRLDYFVLERLEAAGLAPNEKADRRTWIRRVTFDLIGLPPTPKEVRAFLRDSTPTAHERVVDRLLDSTHYGERWARMWLDLARYAEDQAHIVGNDRSLCYPNAYLYRDWVIEALNAGMPYDEFIRRQLAADLLLPDEPEEHAALGFLGLGPKYYRRGAPEVMADEWEDRVDVVTRGLLGLTVACARCHDHKYDPIPTEDYYALAGVFASTQMLNRPLNSEVETKEDGQAKDPLHALHIVRDGEPQDLPVYRRGDVTKPGEIVPRRFLQALSATEPCSLDEGSGRLPLAEAIASPENPLTARVIVNRVWGELFGQPLVRTPSNFGKLGERPTHPRLLDDLSARFMAEGWRLKALQREIVLSATYRQSSHVDEVKYQQDPDNRLLGRMNRRRLSVEAWRDAVLTVTGKIDDTVGGPSLKPADPGERRRTVYSEVSRLELNKMLSLFDFPDPSAHSAGRAETTTPLQKLFVMNSPFMLAQAKTLAARLQADAEQNHAARIRQVYRLLFGRPVSDVELKVGLQYLTDAPADDEAAWTEYAQALLASNEMWILD